MCMKVVRKVWIFLAPFRSGWMGGGYVSIEMKGVIVSRIAVTGKPGKHHVRLLHIVGLSSLPVTVANEGL